MFLAGDKLEITGINCYSLKAMDRDKSSDPFCVLEIGSQTIETQVRKNELNPYWITNIAHTVPNDCDNDSITMSVKIYDWNRFSKNTLMEECIFKFNADTVNEQVGPQIPLSEGVLRVWYTVHRDVKPKEEKEEEYIPDGKPLLTIEEAKNFMLESNYTELDNHSLNAILNDRFDVAEVGSQTLLVEAVRLNMVEMVEYLLKYPRIDPNLGGQSSRGCVSPLYFACQQGNEKIVKLLLDCPKIDVNLGVSGSIFSSSPEENNSPLHATENIEIAKMLLEKPNIKLNTGLHRVTPLMSAAVGSNVELVSLLASHPNAEINTCNKDGKNALFFAISSNKFEHIKVLIENNIEIGYNSFTTTIWNKKVEFFKYLYDHGAGAEYETRIMTSYDYTLRDLYGDMKKCLENPIQ